MCTNNMLLIIRETILKLTVIKNHVYCICLFQTTQLVKCYLINCHYMTCFYSCMTAISPNLII